MDLDLDKNFERERLRMTGCHFGVEVLSRNFLEAYLVVHSCVPITSFAKMSFKDSFIHCKNPINDARRLVHGILVLLELCILLESGFSFDSALSVSHNNLKSARAFAALPSVIF